MVSSQRVTRNTDGVSGHSLRGSTLQLFHRELLESQHLRFSEAVCTGEDGRAAIPPPEQLKMGLADPSS